MSLRDDCDVGDGGFGGVSLDTQRDVRRATAVVIQIAFDALEAERHIHTNRVPQRAATSIQTTHDVL